jgi:hypothetical protein
MTEEQKRAYVIADNKLALNAGWDEQLLALELQYLTELELDFDLARSASRRRRSSCCSPAWRLSKAMRSTRFRQWMRPCQRSAAPAIGGTVAGIGCSAAMRPKGKPSQLMAGAQAELIFTDPPFNVPIDGHACGLGKVRHPSSPLRPER